MTYGHLQADCLYSGISSGPNARHRVWEAFTFTFIDSPDWHHFGHLNPQQFCTIQFSHIRQFANPDSRLKWWCERFTQVVAVGLSMQAINQLRFSHFRQNLLAGACDDCALCTWDSGTKSQLCRFEIASGGHSAPCTGLVFSPCNQMLLASVGLDKNIICYDVIANKSVLSLFLH